MLQLPPNQLTTLIILKKLMEKTTARLLRCRFAAIYKTKLFWVDHRNRRCKQIRQVYFSQATHSIFNWKENGDFEPG